MSKQYCTNRACALARQPQLLAELRAQEHICNNCGSRMLSVSTQRVVAEEPAGATRVSSLLEKAREHSALVVRAGIILTVPIMLLLGWLVDRLLGLRPGASASVLLGALALVGLVALVRELGRRDGAGPRDLPRS